MLVKRLGAVIGAAIVLVSSLSAVAQADEEFVQVGVDDCAFAYFEIRRGIKALMQKEKGYF